jgi:ADP-dependent NAD(P)H-hydrate dehydratase / NAD(P)H-hydrate epimerase
VAARKLHEAGNKVSVIILATSADELRGDAAEMFKKLFTKPLWVGEEKDFQKEEIQAALKAELIVDAILGTGFKPPIKGIAVKAIELIDESSAAVLSVDLPSGADADSENAPPGSTDEVTPDAIMTFTAPKPVHVFRQITDGPVAVAQIGTPAELLPEFDSLNAGTILAGYINLVFGPRPPDANKGNFGHVLVIGGSLGKAGAAAMAGMAALRAGAGLVTVACPRSVQPTVAAFAAEIMTEPLPETELGTVSLKASSQLEALIRDKDAVVLGPGIGRHSETEQLVRDLLSKMAGTKLIVDADGLNAFAKHADLLRSEGLLILTPHPGEMSRLTGIDTAEIQANRLQVVREVAKKHNAVVVLKGHRTLTAVPSGEVWVNLSGNPGMAKGGSGDVLSGMIAASVSQMQNSGISRRISKSQAERTTELMRLRDRGDAAAEKELEELSVIKSFDLSGLITAVAVYLHGLAGDVARTLYGEHSMIATDMIGSIGEAIDFCKQAREEKVAYLQQ